MDSDDLKTSSGVKELVHRLRDEGVMAARAQSEELIAAAKQKAADIVGEAREEAARERAEAAADIAREREAALAALRLAARDASQSLMQALTGTLETHVQRLVSAELGDPAFLRELLLAIAASAGRAYAGEHPIAVELADAFFEGQEPGVRERGKALVLGLSREMLREGVELVPNPEIRAGVRLRIVGDNSELDLSDDALSTLLMHYMVPRFRSILEGVE